MVTEDLCRPLLDDLDVEDQKGDTFDDNKKPREIIIPQWCREAIARHGLFTMLFVVAAATATANLHLLLWYFRWTQSVPADRWLYMTACMTNSYLWLSSLHVSLWSFFPWADSENGFRGKNKMAAVLFLAYFILGVLWDPVTIGLGAVRLGLLISVARLACGIAIGRMVRGLSCNAGDCVYKAGGLLSYFIFRNTLDFVETGDLLVFGYSFKYVLYVCGFVFCASTLVGNK